MNMNALDMRTGALTLAGVAEIASADFKAGREQDAIRLLFGFADDFRGSGQDGRAALIRDEPPLTGNQGYDAALAGEAEFFAREGGVPVPAWTEGPGRFAEPWWFVASRPGLRAYVLQHTPLVFMRHGVFIAREVFDRA
jgi:hypothetical protein